MVKRKEDRRSEGTPTWRELLPARLLAPPLITRAELLAALATAGVDVTERTLRYWETAGALPRAVRQSHEGVVHAVYPEWFPDVVRAVNQHRRQGASLSALADNMAEVIRGVAELEAARKKGIVPLGAMSPEGEVLGSLLNEMARQGSSPDRPIATVVIMLLDEEGLPVFRLPWIVQRESLSDGGLGEPPPDSRVSGGGSGEAPTDSE